MVGGLVLATAKWRSASPDGQAEPSPTAPPASGDPTVPPTPLELAQHYQDVVVGPDGRLYFASDGPFRNWLLWQIYDHTEGNESILLGQRDQWNPDDMEPGMVVQMKEFTANYNTTTLDLSISDKDGVAAERLAAVGIRIERLQGGQLGLVSYYPSDARGVVVTVVGTVTALEYDNGQPSTVQVVGVNGALIGAGVVTGVATGGMSTMAQAVIGAGGGVAGIPVGNMLLQGGHPHATTEVLTIVTPINQYGDIVGTPQQVLLPVEIAMGFDEQSEGMDHQAETGERPPAVPEPGMTFVVQKRQEDVTVRDGYVAPLDPDSPYADQVFGTSG